MPSSCNGSFGTRGCSILYKFSFRFGSHDLYSEFGILLTEVRDVLLPTLRPRKIQIPSRSGQYDFGAQHYDERLLTLSCVRERKKTDMSELAYVLSKKSRITLGMKPDRYYIGRIYDPAEITSISDTGTRFTITFVCDPFIYSDSAELNFSSGVPIRPDYPGTAPAPTLIHITNTSTDTEAKLIRIRIRERRDTT